MNDELLEERMNRRAQEWQVGEPPYREIMGEGRRLRRRRRQWIGGAAASVAVLGLTIGGLAITPGAGPEALPAGPAGPPAEGRWIAVDGVALDVPADWTSPLTACDDDPLPVWMMVGGPNPADVDPCSPGAGEFTIQFMDVANPEAFDFESLKAELPPNGEVDGQPYHREVAGCTDPSEIDGRNHCRGSVILHELALMASVAGDVDASVVDELLATLRVLPAGIVPNPAPFVRPSEASGETFVGVGDISFEIPADWTTSVTATCPVPMGTGLALEEERPAGQSMCEWSHGGETGSIQLMDLATTSADRAELAETFHGLPDRMTVGGRTVGRDAISCSDGSCSVAIYVADPGVHVTISSDEGKAEVQRILDSLQIVPADQRS